MISSDSASQSGENLDAEGVLVGASQSLEGVTQDRSLSASKQVFSNCPGLKVQLGLIQP